MFWGSYDGTGQVGPSPSALAEYIDTKSRARVFHQTYSTGDDLWSSMVFDVAAGDPAVVLLETTMAKAHYVCVVGISDVEGRVALLNTNNKILVFSKSEFKRLACIDGLSSIWPGVGTYNLIRFAN